MQGALALQTLRRSIALYDVAMTDPISVIASVAGISKATDAAAAEAAKTAGALWLKVLGPPAEAIGQHFRARIEQWSDDTLARRVLERAAKKINPDEPGTVPPRVAADIFDKAQWAEDEFVAEYLSGVLASSRTPGGTDDRGVSWTALVGRLSASQLRLHYLLYSTARHLLQGTEISTVGHFDAHPIYIPLLPVFKILSPNGVDLFNEGVMGLIREGLLSERHEVDPDGAALAKKKQIPAGPHFVFRVTRAGVMLYFRGGGSQATTTRWFADNRVVLNFESVADIPVPIEGSSLVADLPDAGAELG